MQDLDRLAPRELLNFIRRSIRGSAPRPVAAGEANPRTRGAPAQRGTAADRPPETQKPARFPGTVSPCAKHSFQSAVTLRIRCIRLLRDSESLTVEEAADRLELAPGLIQSQFLELRQLRLVELAGSRKTRSGIQAVYRLNELNPALDFVLAQGPSGIKSPHEIAERERQRPR